MEEQIIKKKILVVAILLMIASVNFKVVGDYLIDTTPPVITGSSYLLTKEEVNNMTQEEIKEHIESKE